MPKSASSRPPQSDAGEPRFLWWYWGPTDFDPDELRVWHYECSDPVGAGHDGEVWLDHQGGAICTSCRLFETGDTTR